MVTDIENVDEHQLAIQNYRMCKTNYRCISENNNKPNLQYYWPNMPKDIQNFINK